MKCFFSEHCVVQSDVSINRYANLVKHNIIDFRTFNVNMHGVGNMALWIDGSFALYNKGLHCKTATTKFLLLA